jgi:hypothetical protein
MHSKDKRNKERIIKRRKKVKESEGKRIDGEKEM